MTPELKKADKPPAPWWALNGYVLLVALLEVMVGITGILNTPNGSIGWFYRVSILVAGLMLVYSLFGQQVKWEVLGGLGLITGNLAAALNETISTFPPRIEWDTVILQVMIILCISVRVWALRRGGLSFIPPWEKS